MSSGGAPFHSTNTELYCPTKGTFASKINERVENARQWVQKQGVKSWEA